MLRFGDFIFHIFGIIVGGGVVSGITTTEVLRHFMTGDQSLILAIRYLLNFALIKRKKSTYEQR